MNPLLITKYVTVAVLITIENPFIQRGNFIKTYIFLYSKANEAKENTPSVSSSKYLIYYYWKMNSPLLQTNVRDIYMYLYFKKIRVISITIITLLSLHLLAKVIYSVYLLTESLILWKR